MRTLSERAADVRRVVEAGRAVVRGRASLVDEIARTTGLSPEGVALGFAHHVEISATDDDVRALVERAGDAESVHVVLAANVFVAPLRAIAVAVAASERVVVKPSRRAPTFARALVLALDDSRVVVERDVRFEDVHGEVHVYGRDASIAAVRARVGRDAKVRGHGAGMGVAFVTARAEVDEAARLVADDVVPFDQRGCLSPRVVFVEGESDRARAFSVALDGSLEALAAGVPRGALDDDERAEATRYTETIAYGGDVWRATSHVVGLAASVVVPPPGRHVHVVPVSGVDELVERIAPFARYVVAVGSDDPARAAPHAAFARARLSLLGRMQRPPLDGPVDLRKDAG